MATRFHRLNRLWEKCRTSSTALKAPQPPPFDARPDQHSRNMRFYKVGTLAVAVPELMLDSKRILGNKLRNKSSLVDSTTVSSPL
jgi:hypothetical protein